jgi:nitroimidazol reductase NimA-like FMN-containing flavoprotein (pyridoxamine 5'-phosphate oxidase superfamily)
MHFAYDSEYLYFITTEGTKTEYIAANTEVCFQVEEVTDPAYWRSVMVIGHAERITKEDAVQSAMELIKERNPTLTPAINETKIGPWRRLNKIAVYRLRPEALYGRKSL